MVFAFSAVAFNKVNDPLLSTSKLTSLPEGSITPYSVRYESLLSLVIKISDACTLVSYFECEIYFKHSPEAMGVESTSTVVVFDKLTVIEDPPTPPPPPENPDTVFGSHLNDEEFQVKT